MKVKKANVNDERLKIYYTNIIKGLIIIHPLSWNYAHYLFSLPKKLMIFEITFSSSN